MSLPETTIWWHIWLRFSIYLFTYKHWGVDSQISRFSWSFLPLWCRVIGPCYLVLDVIILLFCLYRRRRTGDVLCQAYHYFQESRLTSLLFHWLTQVIVYYYYNSPGLVGVVGGLMLKLVRQFLVHGRVDQETGRGGRQYSEVSHCLW